MGRQLFGTDGIRARAGEYPLDERTVHAVGASLGEWCRRHGQPLEVVIGMDTRESGPWMAAQIAGGLARSGVAARSAGLTTTPGVAYITNTGPFAAGVMISASHNPYHDNGIKIFGHSGYKLPDTEELEIEETIFRLLAAGIDPRAVTLETDPTLDSCYLEHLVSTFPFRLEGMKVAIDCGNGSATHLGPELFRRLGARVEAIGCAPDGTNINRGCGALHVEGLSRLVLESGAAVGFAFDGDADRCITVGPSGRTVDGDSMLLVAARRLLETGHLKSNDGTPVVVATVMSNLGFEKALRQLGVELARTAVGDKYVLEEMLRRGAQVGGEQSGHVIFLEHATTGDGLLTALRVLEAICATGRDIEELAGGWESYPQILVNVRVKERRPLAELHRVNDAIRLAEAALGADGRVLVRFSGTEPLARVMVEGPTLAAVDEHASAIAGAIQAELG